MAAKPSAEELESAKQEWEHTQKLLENLEKDVKPIEAHLQVFKEKKWLPVPDKESKKNKEKRKNAVNDYLKEHSLELNKNVVDAWKSFVALEKTVGDAKNGKRKYDSLVSQSQSQEVEESDEEEEDPDDIFG
mmetsp:Transcript_6701/g.10469  ORF Transcript_6701/g.10469 Transcript_6701/m.10469 type:complete len:132 (+) Transcript_6701:116-511(+)